MEKSKARPLRTMRKEALAQSVGKPKREMSMMVQPRAKPVTRLGTTPARQQANMSLVETKTMARTVGVTATWRRSRFAHQARATMAAAEKLMGKAIESWSLSRETA
jgi:hypothetical protein